MNIPMKLHKQNVARGPKGQAWAPRWWGILLIGLVLWAATAADVFLTGNLIVLPSVVLLGSFLVPVTAVIWYLDHNPSPALCHAVLGLHSSSPGFSVCSSRQCWNSGWSTVLGLEANSRSALSRS